MKIGFKILVDFYLKIKMRDIRILCSGMAKGMKE